MLEDHTAVRWYRIYTLPGYHNTLSTACLNPSSEDFASLRTDSSECSGVKDNLQLFIWPWML